MPNFPNRCQHIKVNGTQCGCPALRRNKLCYFHKLHHEERVELNLDRLKDARARRRNVAITLPVLEDANSIQVSLMQIMRLIVAGHIDGKTAGLLLYALQTASANLPRTSFQPFIHDVVLDVKAVDQTPLSSHIWEDRDFLEDPDHDEEQEEALRRATKRAELELEADRLAALGARERAAEREADRRAEAREQADRKRQQEHAERIALEDKRRSAPLTSEASPETPPSPPASPAKRPPANVTMDEVRKKVTAQIRKALPAIAAAQLRRENRESRENGNSGACR